MFVFGIKFYNSVDGHLWSEGRAWLSHDLDMTRLECHLNQSLEGNMELFYR